MTQPSIEEQLAALADKVASWEPWREEATRRFTAVEELVAGGATRLAQIEAQVTPVLARLAQLEVAAVDLGTRQAELELRAVQLGDLMESIDARLRALGQVARPGRTVIRTQVQQLMADVAALKASQEEVSP